MTPATRSLPPHGLLSHILWMTGYAYVRGFMYWLSVSLVGVGDAWDVGGVWEHAINVR